MDSILVILLAIFVLLFHQTSRAVDARSCVCQPLQKPVCGHDGITYANSCEALCAGVSVAHEEQCGPEVGASQYRTECHCPTISWPVCGRDGVTYSNPCQAFCRNVAVASDGPCELQAIRLIRRRIVG